MKQNRKFLNKRSTNSRNYRMLSHYFHISCQVLPYVILLQRRNGWKRVPTNTSQNTRGWTLSKHDAF